MIGRVVHWRQSMLEPGLGGGNPSPISTEGLVTGLLAGSIALVGILLPGRGLLIFVGTISAVAAVILSRRARAVYQEHAQGFGTNCFAYDTYRSLAMVVGGDVAISALFLVNPHWVGMDNGLVALLYVSNFTLGILIFALSQAANARGQHIFHGGGWGGPARYGSATHSSVVDVVVDATDQIRTVSQTFETHFGYHRADVIGKPLAEVWDEPDITKQLVAARKVGVLPTSARLPSRRSDDDDLWHLDFFLLANGEVKIHALRQPVALRRHRERSAGRCRSVAMNAR